MGAVPFTERSYWTGSFILSAQHCIVFVRVGISSLLIWFFRKTAWTVIDNFISKSSSAWTITSGLFDAVLPIAKSEDYKLPLDLCTAIYHWLGDMDVLHWLLISNSRGNLNAETLGFCRTRQNIEKWDLQQSWRLECSSSPAPQVGINMLWPL